MTWMLPEPMLAAPVPDPVLPPNSAAEPKWDGWRALLSVYAGKVVLRAADTLRTASSRDR